MKPFLIGVAGPSCSGKSVLIKEVWEKGGGISRIKVDNYWKNKNTFPRKLGYRNWDLPESRKFNLLYKNLLELKVGKKTKIPICKKGQFDHFELFEPTPIIIVEGLFLFADKKISDLFDLKIYVCK